MPPSIQLVACLLAEHVDWAIRIVAATVADLAFLQKVVKSASECHKTLNNAIECGTCRWLANIGLGR